MNKEKFIKMISLTLSICFIILILLSVEYIITDSNHECVGDECPVCYALHTAEKSMKTIGSGATIQAIGFLLSFLLSTLYGFLYNNGKISCFSLFAIKVRLNN